MKKTFIALLSLLAMPTMMWAQGDNEINIDAQVRARAEYRNGYMQLRPKSAQPASFIEERARLGVGFERGDGLSAKLSVQQISVWGQSRQIETDGSIMMNEAWGQYKFGDGFFAKLGRQILSYDDERIFGALDWNVAGRSHDALKLGYENDMHKLHLILAYNQSAENLLGTKFAPGQPYKHMQTFWYHYGNEDNPFGISALLSNLGWEYGPGAEGDTKYMQTLGTYVTYRPEKLDLQASAYYQMGKRPTGDTKVSAWMASVNAGFMPNEQWKFNLGYDYLSGEDGKGDTYNAFDPLYGTHHKFYGAMDYFYVREHRSLGLQDIQLGVTFTPNEKLALKANGHYFMDAVKTDGKDQGLGGEVDLQLDYEITQDVKLTVGYSTMLPTKTMDGADAENYKRWQDWAFVSLNINPRILSFKW